jgi:hypothetical protein
MDFYETNTAKERSQCCIVLFLLLLKGEMFAWPDNAFLDLSFV